MTSFGFLSTAEQITVGLDLSSRTMLVTGYNSGLGLEPTRVHRKITIRILHMLKSRFSDVEAKLRRPRAPAVPGMSDVQNMSDARSIPALQALDNVEFDRLARGE